MRGGWVLAINDGQEYFDCCMGMLNTPRTNATHVNFIFEVWMQARSSANETGKKPLHSNWTKCNRNHRRGVDERKIKLDGRSRLS
jgi:hypothetical protein